MMSQIHDDACVNHWAATPQGFLGPQLVLLKTGREGINLQP